MSEVTLRHGMTERTIAAGQEVLAGRRRGLRAGLVFTGPAVIASIAYMDPGNFATNIQAGAAYGYALLWVVVGANLIAMLFQALSAKLGIVTGRNLAEMCRDQLPKRAVYPMWAASEIAAMATDLAEFLGGAIGLSLLFHIPLLAGMAVTAVVTYGILLFEGRGFRPIEIIIGGLVSVIGVCYLIEMFIAPVSWGQAGLHAVVPSMPDAAALTLSVGIIGATVMPHAIFLHSGLTQARVPAAQRGGAAGAGALLQPRDDRRPRRRGAGQHGDGDHGLGRLPRRAQRRGGDRDRLPHARPAARRRRGGGVPDFADGLRDLELGRRNDGRAVDHAGFCRLPHPASGCAGWSPCCRRSRSSRPGSTPPTPW